MHLIGSFLNIRSFRKIGNLIWYERNKVVAGSSPVLVVGNLD